jgi:hypothetical protein
MNARLAVFALAAIVLAAGAWMFLRNDGRTEAAQPEARAGAPVERAAEPEQVEAPPRVELEHRSDVAVAPKTSEEIPAATAKVANAPDVEGTLSIERAGGDKEPAAQAQFALTIWSSDFTKYVDVEVRDGRWTASFPDDAKGKVTGMEVTRVKIGDRTPAIREPEGQLKFPASGPLAVVVYFPDTTILRVVGADTGLELGGVDLVPIEGLLEDDVHPGPNYQKRAIATGVPSPIDMRALGEKVRSGVNNLRVHAAGYAWTKITLDTRAGGERTVKLEPGGSLRLTLIDNSGSKGIQVRLRGPSKEPTPVVSVSASGRSEIALDGLVPGAYTIAAELGDWYRDPLSLGRVEAQITAGQETRATLTIDPAPRSETAAAGGVVIVPSEWNLERVMVTLKLLDTPLEGRKDYFTADAKLARTQEDGQQVFEWSLRDLQVGHYELGVFRPPASLVVELPSGGKTDFRLELAPPADLEVRVVDDITGDDVAVDRLLWNPSRPEGVHGGGLENAELDAATHRFHIRAPEGAIELSVFGNGFAHKIDEVTLVPGHQEHTFRVRRATTVEIVLRDGESTVPFPDEWTAKVETEDGKPIRGGASMSTTMRSYTVPSAGRYRFKLPAINGYEPIADQMVDAEEAKNVKLEVALTRSH